MEEGRRASRWKLDTVNDVAVCYVPWEPLDHADCPQTQIWMDRVSAITQRVRSFERSDYEETFSKNNLALLVFDSNRMEGTISTAMEEGDTMAKILSYMTPTSAEPPAIPWCSEGGCDIDSPSSDRQLFQNAKAVQFLLVDNRNTSLSVGLIVETHRIMMENSYNLIDHGRTQVPAQVGEVRTTKEVNAGMYQFTPASAVVNALHYLVREYNTLADSEHPLSLATYLFYELITIHPFENGNGRLCRMLLSWSLMRDGFPFSVSFSSGHRSRRQDYIHAITRARNSHRGELNVILALSIERVLSNYNENERMIANAKAFAQSCTIIDT